ncbi:DsbA family protein [Acetobacter suratthaniensis]|uniref:DsbA family protein n=1 Tax=Acetobacter suratthaniensis TaxID=1502841 RepID=A0ABS3LMW6_9PROT|nr:DsbA family protein [Acetobacter suratthaniensis]MBO1328718.1 DsbA family protein [Acetobacter suratthaniensis]MCX2566832.1 DsbA family protein [Acetobacter suratthaniensis]
MRALASFFRPALTGPAPFRAGLAVLAALSAAPAALPSGALAATASSTPAAGSFTPTQRAEIISIVREALKSDPSILSDAVASLQAHAAEQKSASALDVVRHNPSLFGKSSTDVVIGNPHGTLEVVEFYDPRCPYCRKVLEDLTTLSASEPELRLVEKVIPILGPNSTLDAQAIMAAGRQNAYLAFQKALMTDTGAPGMERIRRVAASTGLDTAKLEHDMTSSETATALARNVALARSIGLDGTPTFIIGTHEIIPGAVSLEELQAALSRLKMATHP